jgi:carboxyl-terminal processing protease
MVVATIPGGPSEKLGILAGDKIVKIEGKSIAGIGLKTADVREKLMGELGSKVKVEIKRKSSKRTFDYIITRDNIPVHSVDCAYMVTPVTGYIKLTSFSRNTTEEIRTSLKSLKSKGMQNLILDLQDNGGGLLYTAKDVCDEFLSSNKLIVYSEGVHQPRTNLNAGLKGIWESGKLVVLTNENSASASEIVSGAIQDWDRGLIVGRRTFGKGLVQKPISLTDGSEIRLTIARYFTPSGRFIQKPYDDLESYKNDYMDRYLRGEFTNKDSIKKFPDSLKFQTSLKKRTVFGGGGIMPDIFVPLDTAEITEYYKSLSRGGHFNTFTLTYVDKHRDEIFQRNPDFETFKRNFICDDEFMNEFFDFVKKEQEDLEFIQEDYKVSEQLIKLRLKAMVAQDLWGLTEFYQIYNETNEILQAAIKAVESSVYDEADLDKY